MSGRLIAKIAIGGVTILAMVGIYFGVQSNRIDVPKNQNGAPMVFSDSRMLLALWSTYKKNILEPGTLRALDGHLGNATTSEGQSYTMMRAAWMDDQETFDDTWQWTKDNMQRDDKLISWRFGEKPDGSYGIQTEQGGQNTATDADVDIAYALVMASNRWKDDTYLYDAKDIIEQVWEKEVVRIQGNPVLVANDIERRDKTSVVVNPSYFAPYAYRVFAEIDPAHDWDALVDNSYALLFATADATLDTESSAGLTPNWVRINRTTGAAEPDSQLDTHYGYDAFRTPWRLALDYRYNNDVRAKQVLEKYTTLKTDWRENNKLASIYTHDGQVETDDSVPSSYGASLGYFVLEDPEVATEIYEQKLLPNYNPDTQSWRTELSYYDDNWAWFGMALYLDKLPDIAGTYGSE